MDLAEEVPVGFVGLGRMGLGPGPNGHRTLLDWNAAAIPEMKEVRRWTLGF